MCSGLAISYRRRITKVLSSSPDGGPIECEDGPGSGEGYDGGEYEMSCLLFPLEIDDDERLSRQDEILLLPQTKTLL